MQIDKNREDASSRKTKSYHKPNKSDSNNKPYVEKRQQMMVFVNRAKEGSSQRNYSDKGSSDLQDKQADERSITNRDVDGKTEINKEIASMKNKELQEQLQQAELVREGLAKSNEKKIKIASRKRQVISHDILHPPININQKAEKKQIKHQNQSERIEQEQYEEIAHNVRLDNLQSKIVDITTYAKKQETFLAKINESQSQVISSPLNNQKLGITPSPQKQHKVNNEQGQSQKKSESFLKMGSIEEQGINDSVERTFKDKQTKQDQRNNVNKIQLFQQQSQCEKLTEKKSNKVEQGKVFLTTKDLPKTNNKLTLVTATVQQKLRITPNQQEQGNKRLSEEISLLKQAVRELRLQKIKARAQFSTTIDYNTNRAQKKSRYETLNTSVDKNNQKDESNPQKFGTIRKNKSFSRKKVYSSKYSNELSIQRQLDLPDPIINIKKLPQKTKINTFLSQRKNNIEQQPKQYKTMDLKGIAQQYLQESFKYQGNLATSIDMPVYGSNLRSNKINMRGIEICNQVLNKFQTSQRTFRDFVHSSSKNKTQSSRIEVRNVNPTEPSNQGSFGGTIVKNNYTFKPSVQSNRIIDLKNISLIRQGQKITLRKANKDFAITSIPQTPNSPTYSTSTEDLMELILKVLPLTDLKYSSQNLQDCIMKKFKNCLMFELKGFPLTKVVWYFNGKLYIGGWDDKKNEKSGFGKEISKGKSYFEGNYKENKRNGKGSLVSQSYVYEGQWVNGEREGHGKYINSMEGIYYQGQWVKGKKDGKGHYQYEGSIYQGIFQRDIKQGFGIQFFKNGDKYIGTYENSKFQGQGKYLWSNGSFYLGHFRQGFRQGLGKWQSGLDNYELYIGQFHRDKKQGNGKYVWNNRCVYQGNFFNDLKHGLGSILYPDGRYVQGIWTQGILTEILSKLAQANKQQPLDEPKSRTLQSRTIIRILQR